MNTFCRYAVKLGFIIINPYSFEINPSGEIRLVQPVDYELTGDTVDLTVEASDEGGRSSVALVKIFVENHNDEAPQFQFLEYQTTVDETKTELEPPIIVRVSDRIDSPSTSNSIHPWFDSSCRGFLQIT